MAGKVLSNDSDNREAVAAALYFPALFGNGFFRGSDDPRNAVLNYGYAVMRAGIARNLVVHGLEPCIGLHHRSELNNFNLADDLIEPFRPIVDLYVVDAAAESGAFQSHQLSCEAGGQTIQGHAVDRPGVYGFGQ